MRSFRNRLLVLIIGLVVAAQIVTLLAVLARTSATMLDRAQAQLTAGASVARRLIEFRAAQLSNAVSVLAADYGLREAIATGDKATILSAVRNHSHRIGADLLLVLDTDGRLVAASEQLPSLTGPAARLLTEEAGSLSYLSLGNVFYQVHAAPVRAPDLIAYVAIGFELDRQLAHELHEMLSVDVALLSHDSGRTQLVASSLDEANAAATAAHLSQIVSARQPRSIGTAADLRLAISERLASGRHGASVVLLQPMQLVMAPYYELRNTLFTITLLAVALAAGVALFLGNASTRPVAELAAGAQRIERGEYGAKLAVTGAVEFEQLAASFNAMQSGIADREARITHQALHDDVTQLPNRRHFEGRLLGLLNNRADNELLAVAIIEIANLREFSGSLGFSFADQILAAVSRRLKSLAHDARAVARLDGSRFALAMTEGSRTQTVAKIDSICGALPIGLRVAGVNVRIDLTAGIAFTAELSDSPEEFLRRAEIALDHAHHNQRRHSVFEPQLDAAQQRRLQLSADLPEAIGSGQMHLLYQPKVTMQARRVRSAEALVRWSHNSLGGISPSEFVPLAENTGSFGLLTRWVLSTALRQLASWRQSGCELDLAINLSAGDIVDAELPAYISGQLKKFALPGSVLLLEITESAVMRDPLAAARHMEQLRLLGVRFAIDDFGTGYSSLAQLKRLPVDELKIDRSFVRDSTNGEEDAAIVRSTIELGHSMGLRVVAEGVETEAQWRLLRQLGCDDAQGYLIATPLNPQQFVAFLDTSGQRLAQAHSETAVLRVFRKA